MKKTFEVTVEFTHRHEVMVDADDEAEARELIRGGFYRATDDLSIFDADTHTEEIIDIIEAPQ